MHRLNMMDAMSAISRFWPVVHLRCTSLITSPRLPIRSSAKPRMIEACVYVVPVAPLVGFATLVCVGATFTSLVSTVVQGIIAAWFGDPPRSSMTHECRFADEIASRPTSFAAVHDAELTWSTFVVRLMLVTVVRAPVNCAVSFPLMCTRYDFVVAAWLSTRIIKGSSSDVSPTKDQV